MKKGKLERIDRDFLDCDDDASCSYEAMSPLSHEAKRYGKFDERRNSLDLLYTTTFSPESLNEARRKAAQDDLSIKNNDTYSEVEIIKNELEECLLIGTAAKCAEYAKQIQFGCLRNVELRYSLELYKRAFIKYFKSFKQEIEAFANLSHDERMEQGGRMDSKVEQIKMLLPKDIRTCASTEVINAAIKYVSTGFVYIPTNQAKLEMDIERLYKEWNKLNTPITLKSLFFS